MNPNRFVLPVLSALVCAASSAFGARVADVVSKADYASVYNENGDPSTALAAELSYFFDENFANYQKTAPAGYSVILDFTDEATNDWDNAEWRMYVTDVKIGHKGDSKYSLYYSTDKTTWTPVPEAVGVQESGTQTFSINGFANYVKYVFDTAPGGTSSAALAEFQVLGYGATPPKIVSSYSIASFFNANGTAMEANGQGGNNGNAGQLFDGDFTYYLMWPRAHQGGYVVVDFTKNDGTTALQEYYLTQMLVGSNGKKKFSLGYSVDGNTWKTVEGANEISFAGVKTNEVGVTAKKVRYVWAEGSSWDFSTDYLAEFEVWGMNPNDLPCTHPSLETNEWTTVDGSATCTARGIDERFCPDCGKRFTKSSPDLPPLGHDYISTLIRPGTFKKHGTGSITCSRCDFRIDFTNNVDTAITNGPVDLISVGGLAMFDLIQFTDVDVSSTDHLEWGANPFKMVNNTWTVSGGSWDSAGLDDQHADFIFGTEIDLTSIQIVLRNTAQTLLFFDVDDDTGEETQLTQFTILRTDVYTNAADLAAIPFPTQIVTQDNSKGTRVSYRFYPALGNGEYAPVLDYGKFGTDTWDSLVVTNDLNIPTYRTNPDGTHPMHQKKVDNVLQWEDEEHTIPVMEPDDNGSNQFQAFLVRFYEQPCKHLRIRQDTTQPTGYTSWSGKDMSILECHPCGIVRGGGETRYRKETLIILR